MTVTFLGLFLLVGPRASAATCASGDLDGSFASSPLSGSITAEGEVDCYTLSAVSVDDRVSIGFDASAVVSGSPQWRIVDGNGTGICSSYTSSTCSISGASGWSIQVYDGSASAGTFSYSIVSRRLNNPQGCSPLGDPPSWSFASPRVDGSITSDLDARCYTFSRTFGEADGSYWFRSIRTAGSLSPYWSVYGPSGVSECQGSYDGLENRCQLLAYGQFAFVVSTNGGSQSGSFLATARRLTAPDGCASAPSAVIGSTPASGSISTVGKTDCYTLSGLSAGDSVSVALSSGAGSNQSPRWSLIDGTGNRICDSYSGYNAFSPCQLNGTPGWTLVVYDAGTAGTFSYSLAVRRLTDPQGCSSLGAPAVWSFASSRLNGSIDSTLDASCYTFTREPGEEDGSYWFRTSRSAGSLAPQWVVYGPSGTRECEGGENGLENRCHLLASGQYILLVADGNGDKTGSFFATARRLTDPTGCSSLPSIAFGAAPVTGDLSSGGSVDCYSLPSVGSGDSMSIDFFSTLGANPSPRWTLIDGNGIPICESYSYGIGATCPLFGVDGWSLLVYDGGAGSFSYSLAARRLTNPQGCAPLGDPAAWSFTAPRINGSIDSTLASRCYTFTRSASEPDGAYWFRSLRTSGTLSPEWQVYGPTGQRECRGFNDGPQSSCRLLASGQFTFVVADSIGNQTGSYFASGRRLNSPEGCSELSSIAFGIAPVAGNLSTGGEVDCYRLNASSQDILKFTGTGSVDSLALVDDQGTVRCNSFGSSCTVSEDGQMTLLVYSFNGTTTGSYHFEAECENVPCGQSNTAVTDVTPNRVGPSEFTSVLLRGRDLELLESATLSRNGTTIEGDLQKPAPDGRAIEVRFDLSGASLGSWELKSSFLDGTTRNLQGAVTVEPLRPARVSVELIGREAFRAGRPSTVTVSVHNSGNVDGMIVPIALSGIPVGSTVVPLFDMRRPTGSASSPNLEIAPFDQSSDALVFDDGIAVPMYIPRVPAGRTMQFEYRITAPTQGTSYKLRVVADGCLGTPGSDQMGASAAGVAALSIDVTPACVTDIAQQIISFVPFGDCFNAGFEAANIIGRAIFYPMFDVPDDDPGGTVDGISFGLSAAGCGLEASGVGGIAKRVVQVGGLVTGGVQAYGDCLAPQSESELPQNVVTAIDPNEIVGPAGVGSERFIAGDEPLDYRVLFENLPTATAPAQRVEVLNQLDVSQFDPSSVLFHDVRFGSTVFSLPYASHELDHTIDLRPDRNLLVDVKAGVSPAGLIEVELQALDPDTLEPPSDPLEGFLPPNAVAPEGEGQFSYTVTPKALPSGTVVSNKASIRFDENDPIETPTWTNKIDRQPPSASVLVEGGDDPDEADVSWSGTDDAAGIAMYEIRVSKDGGPFTLWKASSSPGSGTFVAEESGTYSFRVATRDGADNVGQSSLAGVTLQVTSLLTVARVGSGSGTVSSSPAGILCGSTCSKAFPTGGNVTLSASPDPGSVFAGWSGGSCSGTGTCTVSVGADTLVTAKFNPAAVVVEQPKPRATVDSSPPIVPRDNRYEECVSAAVQTFKKANKAAKRRHGKSRLRAIKAARKQKERRLAQCKARF